jgi:hypothetical protein
MFAYPRDRVGAVLQVQVFHGQRPLGHFRTRDVARDGMFVEAGADAPPVESLLELHLHLFGTARPLRGVVTYVTDDGFDARLTGGADVTYQALVEVLHGCTPERREALLNAVQAGSPPHTGGVTAG